MKPISFLIIPQKLLIPLSFWTLYNHMPCRIFCHPGPPSRKLYLLLLDLYAKFFSSTDEKLNFVCRTFQKLWLELCFNSSIQVLQGHVPATCNNLEKKRKLCWFQDLLGNCKELSNKLLLNYVEFLVILTAANRPVFRSEISQSEAFSRFEDQQPGKLVNVSQNCVCWQLTEKEGKNFSECDLNI